MIEHTTNMISPAIFGEAPIPSLQQPATADGRITPKTITPKTIAPKNLPPETPANARTDAQAALLRLACLWVYVRIMGLFGYRIRPERRRRAPHAAPPADPTPNPAPATAPQPAPQPAPKPRRKHRYLDGDMIRSTIGEINAALVAAQPPRVPAPAPALALALASALAHVPAAPPAAPARTPGAAKSRTIPRPAAPRAAAPAPMASAAPPPNSRPFKNRHLPVTLTHAHFVAISKRTQPLPPHPGRGGVAKSMVTLQPLAGPACRPQP